MQCRIRVCLVGIKGQRLKVRGSKVIFFNVIISIVNELEFCNNEIGY